MVSEFILVLALAGFGLVAAVPMLILPKLIAPNRPGLMKNSAFECGQTPTGEGKMSFMMQYYSFLIMFVIIDVMAIFLFAWGVAYLELGLTSALPVIGFLAIMMPAIGYALYMSDKKNVW
ncbi:MAG: NADH-quinone oxidoreductase subunit A [Nitrososphaerales archaeon]